MDIPLNTLSGVDRASRATHNDCHSGLQCAKASFQIGADSVSTDFAVVAKRLASGSRIRQCRSVECRFQRARVLGSAKDEFLDHVPAHILFDSMR